MSSILSDSVKGNIIIMYLLVHVSYSIFLAILQPIWLQRALCMCVA